MKHLVMSVAVFAVLGLVASTQAQCGSSSAKGSDVVKTSDKPACQKSCGSKEKVAQKACCGSDKTAKACCDKAKTAGDPACTGKVLVASGAPLMTYKVGNETTRCPKQASEWAAKCDKSTVVYVLGDDEYTCKTTANKAWTDELNKYLDSMTSVRYAIGDECVACPNAAQSIAKASGKDIKFRVASHTFDMKDQAELAAKRAREAANKVTMTMVIDGKEYSCCSTTFKCVSDGSSCTAKGEKTARAGCDKSEGKRVVEGKCCEYRVGEMKTACQTTAELELVKARVAAAEQSLEETQGEKVAGS